MKEQIQNLVSQARTGDAIQLMLDNSPYHLHSEIVSLSERFKTNEKENRMGTIERGNYSTEKNKINASILYYASEFSSNSGGYEPAYQPQPQPQPEMKNSLAYFLDWWDTFKPSTRQDQSSTILSQLVQLTEWMSNMPGFEEFLLPLQQVEMKLKNKSMTSVQACESLKELVEGLLLLEQDLALEVGLKPLYDTAISPAGTKADIENFLASWKKKYPKDATVKSNIDTANEYLSTGNFEAVKVVKTKGYLKSITINF